METNPAPEEPSPVEDEASCSVPAAKEDIAKLLAAAMEELKPELKIDISQMTWEFGAENDLKNLYYAVLSEHPELKYAYDMKVALQENTASCTLFYMPYMTNDYKTNPPAGSHTVSSLRHAKTMAQGMIGRAERLPIAITDQTLIVDDIQRSLAQAGYGWIGYTLNQDGTEIVAAPPVGKTMDECVAAINTSFELCVTILSTETTPEMAEYEKIQALYRYVVNHGPFKCFWIRQASKTIRFPAYPAASIICGITSCLMANGITAIRPQIAAAWRTTSC